MADTITQLPKIHEPPLQIGPYIVRATLKGQPDRLVARADDGNGREIVAKGPQNNAVGEALLYHELHMLLALNSPVPHENIVHPAEARLLPDNRGKAVYLALVWGGGETLDKLYLRRELRENLHEHPKGNYLVVSIVQLARALAFAHQRGIVHGDVKPENTLCNGTVKVIDFENADYSGHLRANPLVLQGLEWQATPRYASREQADGIPPTTASDVYSLGAAAWVVIKGERTAAPYDHVFWPEGSPRKRVPRLNFKSPRYTEADFVPLKDFGALLYRALDRDPERRPTVMQVYEAGKEFGEELPDPLRDSSIDATIRSSDPGLVSPYIAIAGGRYARSPGPPLEGLVKSA